MMLCDSHIHVGQFFDRYTSPKDVMELTKRLGIAKYAVSSTTICEENYSKVLDELSYLSIHDTERAHPVLWVTPALLSNQEALNNFLGCGLQWCCLKIHPDLHPKFWTEENGFFDILMEVAEEFSLPVLIHTGGNAYSKAGIWENKIASFADQVFILAHSRPCSQTIALMHKYENVYADLAFVGKEDMKKLTDSSVSSRLIWGSDIPITEYYLHQPIQEYYSEIIEYLRDISTREVFEHTIYMNFKNLLSTS